MVVNKERRTNLSLGVLSFLFLVSLTVIVYLYFSLSNLKTARLKKHNQYLANIKGTIGQKTPTPNPKVTTIIKKRKTYVVSIRDQEVSPQTLIIDVYDRVQWVNKDNKVHQIKSEDLVGFSLDPKSSFNQTFEKTGTYNYSCVLYPNLKGTIIVN